MGDNQQTVSKFTFDTEFRVKGDLVSNAARARKRKTFTQEELDQICAKAHSEGIKAGQVRAIEKLAASVDALGKILREALDASRGEIETVRQEAAQIALCAARKLARVALEAHPAGEVEDALREAIHQAVGEPRIVLRASQEVVEALTSKLEEIAHDEGYDGRIAASVDPAAKNSDCRIEWRGGGAERNFDTIEAAISDVIARRFTENPIATSTKG